MLRVLFFAIAWASVGVAAMYYSQDARSAYEKCRYVTAADLADARAPRFESYGVANEKLSAPKLDLSSNPIAKRYRTVLRLDAEKGPNFAGHYRLVEWGCGSSCEMFAVVNLRSGRVITPQDFDRVSGVFFYADDFLPQTDGDGWGFRYKLDSKLLVVIGDLAEDESREGAFYFVLEGEKLRPAYSTRVHKDCESAKPRGL